MEIGSIQPNSNSVRPSSVPPLEAAQRRELIQAAKVINSSEVLGQKDELVFAIDPGSRRAIVRIVDRNTREVVLQLPSEYVLRLAEDLSRKS